MRAELLHVVGVYCNPCMWAARKANFERFEDHMLASGVKLTTVEIRYHHRPFDLTRHEGLINRVRLTGHDVLWHKENAGNLGVQSIVRCFDPQAEYIALVDGDFTFLDPNWAMRTVHALQLHKIVQITSELIFLGPNGEHIGKGESLMSLYFKARQEARALHMPKYYDGPLKFNRHGYPGGAWAYRREALDSLGGLLDKCIVGAGDHHMAQGILELSDRLAEPTNAGAAYTRIVNIWRDRAARNIRRDVGLVPGMAMHHWHGRQPERHYPNRWRILQRNDFDPDMDIDYDSQGLLQLTGNKPHLRDDIRQYLQGRNEDANTLA